MQDFAARSESMTFDRFLAWAAAQPEGRYELVDGEIVTMPAEGGVQNVVKLELAIALRQAVAAARLPCGVFTDGMTVRIDDGRGREPDASVTLTRASTLKAQELVDPVIVCEVLSPTSQSRDKIDKLVDYFRVPSIRHYLIIDPERRLIIHHGRQSADGDIITRFASAGTLRLDPPGLDLAIAALFMDLGPAEAEGTPAPS